MPRTPDALFPLWQYPMIPQYAFEVETKPQGCVLRSFVERGGEPLTPPQTQPALRGHVQHAVDQSAGSMRKDMCTLRIQSSLSHG